MKKKKRKAAFRLCWGLALASVLLSVIVLRFLPVFQGGSLQLLHTSKGKEKAVRLEHVLRLSEETLSLVGFSVWDVAVEWNGIQEEVFAGGDKFQYEKDLTSLEEGWYLIAFKNGMTAEGFWLHKVGDGKPSYVVNLEDINAGREKDRKGIQSYTSRMMKNYTTQQDYFDSKNANFNPGEALQYDANGIPMTRYQINGKYTFEYNPVTIIQYGLMQYGKALESGNYAAFLHVVDWLMEYQDEDGGLAYHFPLLYGDQTLPEGLISGMAQGQFLSLLSRAYLVNSDSRYLEAGKKAMEIMIAPFSEGGTAMSLDEFIQGDPTLQKYAGQSLYEEYPMEPSAYVLNGSLFGLIGLYDWSQIASEEFGRAQAKAAFEQGCQAVETVLPYYDYNGWSSYDLWPFIVGIRPNFQSSYAHPAHIYLLHTLAEITKSSTFEKYFYRFQEYYKNEEYQKVITLDPSFSD